MTTTSPFATAEHYRPLETVDYRGVRLPARFHDTAREYKTVRDSCGLFDRSHRGLVTATGADRKPWLHNLVTNAVSTLAEDAGVYAFAVNVKGRVQFDLNILNLPDKLWLDVDAQAVPDAIAHLERYLVTEDVQVTDTRSQYARIGCAGPQATLIANRVRPDSFGTLPALSSVELSDGPARLVRNDFAGLPGFELIVPRDAAAEWWDRLVENLKVTPIGFHVQNVLRIEAGIPRLGCDIDPTVLPPETGQIERGISYHKGCYLGQEVIERMRSRGVLARRLVRLSAEHGDKLKLPAPLLKEAAVVGHVTSWARHPVAPGWIGLGYIKTGVADTSYLTVGGAPVALSAVG